MLEDIRDVVDYYDSVADKVVVPPGFYLAVDRLKKRVAKLQFSPNSMVMRNSTTAPWVHVPRNIEMLSSDVDLLDERMAQLVSECLIPDYQILFTKSLASRMKALVDEANTVCNDFLEGKQSDLLKRKRF